MDFCNSMDIYELSCLNILSIIRPKLLIFTENILWINHIKIKEPE